jgi:universal stress protein E
VQKVKQCSPDLVIKRASGRHPMRRISLDDNDWQLARSCPATLLLTRARPWHDSPRFAAAALKQAISQNAGVTSLHADAA